MEHRRNSSSSSSTWFLFTTLSCLFLSCFLGSVGAYKNYTVGDSLGWFDKLEKPAVNYQKWVAKKQFSLGDFLIFNTDSNHTIVQTYNFTTYKQCDYDDAQDKDTLQWSSGSQSNGEVTPLTVAVPLLKEGPTYFFSSDYDGEQCKNGQHFKINVTHGLGLPKSLLPEDDSPSPSSPVSGDDDSAPDTTVPSNFNNPKEDKDDDKTSDEKSGSYSVLKYAQLYNKFYVFLVLLGVFLLF
ncbi:unnamed protein product [Vicia faba]|uniref:Phytocyanin domain-containing protein n=1 Tax=Vicia faba TaxID=3906 RepID=A0AAV0YKU3_VICFA|nr:unnamed protein product [Vicia faba]